MPREWRWWVYGQIDGTPVILGGYVEEEKADSIGTDAFDGMYEKVYLPTTNKEAATSQIKHKVFEKTHDLRYSLRPVRHSLGKKDETQEGNQEED